MPSSEAIEYTIGCLELQYQMALAEVKQYEMAAAAWKNVTNHMNTQINHLVKKYASVSHDSNPEDHVIVYISDD